MAEHQVETVFTATDRATATIQSLASRMEALHMQAERAKGGLERLLVPALGFVGVGLGVREMARKFSEVYEQADKIHTSITAAYLASGRFSKLTPGQQMFASVKKGEEAFERIEEMAGSGVASTQTYANVYKSLALPALEKTRASQEKILQFSEDLVPVMGAIGGSTESAAGAARNLGFIMTTGFGRPPRELMNAISMTNKEFRKLQKQGAEPLFNELSKRVGQVAPQFKKLLEDPGVQIQRLRNRADEFMRIMGTPVMEAFNEQAIAALKWLKEHRAEAIEIAKQWGTSIKNKFVFVVDLAKKLADHLGLVVTTISAIRFAPSVLGVLTQLGSLGAGIGGAGGGSAVAGGAIPLFGNLGKAIAGGGGLIPAIEKAGAGLMVALGPGGLAIAAAAAFAGALYAASEAVDAHRANAIKAKGELPSMAVLQTASMKYGMGESTALMAKRLGINPEELTKYDPQGRRMDVIGGGGGTIARTMMEMGYISKTGALTATPEEMQRKMEETFGLEERQKISFSIGRLTELVDTFAKMGDPSLLARLALPASFTEGFGKGLKPEVNFNNNKFDIRQAFAEGFEPDRIALAFTNDLLQLGDRRLHSGLAIPFAGG